MSVPCPDCHEMFTDIHAWNEHKPTPDQPCEDPRTDVRWRVDNDGHWTMRAHQPPPPPAVMIYGDDMQKVHFNGDGTPAHGA